MPCISDVQLDDIIDFEIAIKKLYLKLANLEYESKLGTDEYHNIFSLLASAKRIEEGKFQKLNIDKFSYNRLYFYLTLDIDNADLLNLLENLDNIERIRLNNILGAIHIQNNGFITDEELASLKYGEKVREALAHRQYQDLYEKCIQANAIYVLNEDLGKMTDAEIRKYFIYLKYFNIYIDPAYESNFINNGGTVRPLININHIKYQAPDCSQEEYDNYNYINLTNEIMLDILCLFEDDLEDLKSRENRFILYNIIPLIKARLISLQDKAFISHIRKNVNQIINKYLGLQGEEKQELRNIIDEMFADSYEILLKIEEKRKLELK